MYDQPRPPPAMSPFPPPMDYSPRPPEREPSTLRAAAGAPMMLQPVAPRRSGKLGALVVGIAIAAGGASAYFIATSDDLEGEGDRVGESAAAGKQAAAPAQPKVDEQTVTPPAPATPAGQPDTPGDPQATPPSGAGEPPSGAGESPSGAGESPVPVVTPPSGKEAPPPGEDVETNRRPAALVTLQIDSLPRGALVIRKADGVRLGETPFTYQTEPQPGSVTFVLRHKGYREEVVTVPANRSVDRKVPLTRSAGPDRAPSIHDP